MGGSADPDVPQLIRRPQLAHRITTGVLLGDGACSATGTEVHPPALAVCSTWLGWVGCGRETRSAWIKKEKKLSGLI